MYTLIVVSVFCESTNDCKSVNGECQQQQNDKKICQSENTCTEECNEDQYCGKDNKCKQGQGQKGCSMTVQGTSSYHLF